MATSEISTKHFVPDYNDFTNDKRLDARLKQLSNSLCMRPGSNISQLSESRADQIAYYRLLENDKLSEKALMDELTSRMGNLCTGRDLLCVQDTCEINLSKNKNRVKPNAGLGGSDNSENATCFKIHPGLVLDEHDFNPLGFSGIKVFHREEEMPDRHERNYKRQPIQEKKSYKWIEVAQQSKVTLSQAHRVTFIQDREGDIYEQFAIVPDQNHHLLIRSRTTRKLSEGSDLYSAMKELPISGTYLIEIDEDKRNKRQKRTAQMAIGHGQFRIKRPASLSLFFSFKTPVSTGYSVNC